MQKIKDFQISSQGVSTTIPDDLAKNGFLVMHADAELYSNKNFDLENSTNQDLTTVNYDVRTDITGSRGILPREFAITLVGLIQHFIKYFKDDATKTKVKLLIIETLQKELNRNGN